MTIAIASILSLFLVPSFGLTVDPEMPKHALDVIQQDFDFLRSIRGEAGRGPSPLHQKLFGPVSGVSYLAYLEARANFLNFGDCKGSPREVAGCAFESDFQITQTFTELPQFFRVAILMHEARHLEPWAWGHVLCPVPFRDAQGKDIISSMTGRPVEGRMACDDNAMGSYGADFIFLKNLEKRCASCTAEFKRQAGERAAIELQRIINPEARRMLESDAAALGP